MKNSRYFLKIFLFLLPTYLFAQEVSLLEQFNGHYDYLAFGNTLNIEENSSLTSCAVLTESNADFQLTSGQQVTAAYLYWAGSGSGDFEVSLNNNPINAERNFSFLFTSDGIDYIYFAAVANVTNLISTIGNGIYTFSDLNLEETIQPYCRINGGNGTNFGGWAVIIIYEDPSLPLNQVSIFDGLEAVSVTNNVLNINLENISILDNEDSKIGFLSWEGDSNLAENETLIINGSTISNPPLNPMDNAFNSTNSFTNSDQLFNMDIDFYNIENNINPGDTNVSIQLTSTKDLVMINNVVTVFNSELPDATIEIDSLIGGNECGNYDIEIDYTIYNVNSTASLPINTPIAFYANETFISQAFTTTEIPINESENGAITVTIPNNIPADFTLKAVVDDTGNGFGIVDELNESNNEFTVDFHLLVFPDFDSPLNIELCNILGTEVFNLTEATSEINTDYFLSYHISEDDAQNNNNPIIEIDAFLNTENPQTIFIRVANEDCFLVDSFEIKVIECPLPDATIMIDNELYACRQRDLIIDYTVYNTEATGILPANTDIAFYFEGIHLAQSQTENNIPIGGSESNSIEVFLPEDIPDIFEIIAVVDDNGNGIGSIEELNEINNSFQITIEFGSIPPIDELPNLLLCDEGFDTATFNLTVQNELISLELEDLISYFTTLENAIANENEISDPGNYQNGVDPQIIYVRLENEICFTTASFLIETENCAPYIPEGFSPNGDGINDEFEISNLLNIYSDFELQIYSRYGNLIYKGYNRNGFWDGITNEGLFFYGSLVPTGVYYYVLILNDSEFPDPFIGDVYVNY